MRSDKVYVIMLIHKFIFIALEISFLCLTFIITNNPVLANVGGHALFASLSQLEDLWYNEIRTVHLIEELSKHSEDPPDSLDS